MSDLKSGVAHWVTIVACLTACGGSGGTDAGADGAVDAPGVDAADSGSTMSDGGDAARPEDAGQDAGDRDARPPRDAGADSADAGADAGAPSPRLLAATYLGDPGSTNATANQSARNALWSSAGDLVVSGLGGQGAPTTAGAYQRTYAGHGGRALGGDCWVGRLSEDLSTLNAATYYGGPGEERPCYGLAELSDGSLVIGGHTSSNSGIATAGAFQPTRASGASASAFVAILTGDLSGRVAGTYLGANGTLRGGVRVLSSGDILAFGQVDAGAVTTTGAVQASPGGGLNEGWIGALSPNLSTLRWGTFLGSNSGQATEVVVAAAEVSGGDLVFQSSSPSTSWLAGRRTTGAQPMGGNANRPFVGRLSPSGTQALDWVSVLGPSDGASQAGGSFQEPGIAVDGSGNIIVTGEALTRMGTTGTLGASLRGGSDCYVCKLGPTGSIQWCTHVGGTGADRCIAPQVAASGDILIGGTTDSASLCGGADMVLNGTHAGGDDAFLAVLSSDGTRMRWCTLLGGSGDEVGRWVAVRGDGHVAFTGLTQSADFPATSGAYDPSYNGNDDMFVSVYQDVPSF